MSLKGALGNILGRFDKYLLHQLLMLFGLFSLILVLVFWVNKAVILLDRLMGDGQSITTFLQVTTLGLPSLISDVLPITAFIAAVFAINRMSSESELVVVQATGYSPWRLARPVLVFGILVTLMVASLTHALAPLAQRELSLRSAEISRDITAKLLTEGSFVHPIKGVTFYVREIPPSGELFDIYLSDNRTDGVRRNFLARRALIVKEDDGPVLLMFDGESHEYDRVSKKLSVTTFKSFAYGLGGFLNTTSTSQRALRAISTYEMMTSRSAVLTETGEDPAEMRKTIHDRTAKALLSIVAPLIGFAGLIVGGFSRFGLWRQIFLSFALLIFVKSIDSVGISATRRDPNDWPQLYMAVGAGLLITAALLWYSANPNVFRKKLPKTKAETSQ
ncbi:MULTISPECIES: LptF/LptG family permease [Pacificibacter]|uniref:LptF/LptG family permease n=1 Tax=Pacificibacter TaxID=1042323 RepID=UPI001C09802F|nr:MULTISPECIES: LptF/LptG family permease [Pacificibacter]MBU2936929.1 LptF/LptG family permease [Pacificibacter marinus]MDO6614923.1 LptF/LptG family permease [Pacificibacter sp. 1_MG-2023]